MKDIKTRVYSNVDETIKMIQEMVQIPSVRDVENSTQGVPFGVGITKSLDKYLEFAQSIGMRTYKDPEGYYGYAEIGPEDGDMIGIVGHLDVVPVGNVEKWEGKNPFSGDIINDAIYGRGSLDDKGPLVIALMAIKSLIDEEVAITKRIRIILGTAEETTWEGIDKYREKEEHPTYGFTPDADFPVIHAEKTIYQADVVSEMIETNFKVSSDGAYNSVADEVIYEGSKVDEIEAILKQKDYKYEKISSDKIKVLGTIAHAAYSYKGDNAIYKLVEAMVEVGEVNKTIEFIHEAMEHTYHGEKLFGNVEDEVTGKLTMNLGWIKMTEDETKIGIDMRIPVLADTDDILSRLKKKAELFNLKIENGKAQDKLYVPKDSDLITNLMNAYVETTGDKEAKPLTTGGGTYARAFDNLVAYGMVFSNYNMIDNMHQTNECMELKFIPMGMEVYARALEKLINM